MHRKLLLLFALLLILFIGYECSTLLIHADASQIDKILPDRVMVTTPYRNGTPLPAIVNITNSARVQALYDALYALPRVPKDQTWRGGLGPVSFTYTLDFYEQNHLFKRVLIPTISFRGFELEPHDYRQVTRQFWSLLIQTIKNPVSK